MVREGERPADRTFGSVAEVLAFAIEQEEKAEAFYRRFAETASEPGLRRLCLEMAEEEQRHAENLRRLRDGKPTGIATERVRDLKISDYLREMEIRSDMTHQDLLIAAMQSEKKAELLYRALADASTDPEVRALFTRLADEEGSHKDDIEKKYDDRILRDN